MGQRAAAQGCLRPTVPAGDDLGKTGEMPLLVAVALGQALLLVALRRLGLSRRGAAWSTAASLALGAAMAAGLRGRSPGPADAVTLARGLLACDLAGLDADPVSRDLDGMAAGLSAVALALDAVDGQVARRTGTVSEFGARFDGETDALLILVLSRRAARHHGRWVLLGGLARHGFALAGAVFPWLRRPLPFRYWRKVATATEGIALAAATAPFVPRRLARWGLVAGLVLIAESFGRDVWWLWRRRRQP